MTGIGILLKALLSAIQAPLANVDDSSSTGASNYSSSYRATLEIAISVAVFNIQFGQHLEWTHDATIHNSQRDGWWQVLLDQKKGVLCPYLHLTFWSKLYLFGEELKIRMDCRSCTCGSAVFAPHL